MQIKNRMSSSFIKRGHANQKPHVLFLFFIKTTEKHTFYVEKHLKKKTSNCFKCYFYTIDNNIMLLLHHR